MKNTMINTLFSAIFITSLSFASISAMAARDFYQEQLIQNIQLTKQKLQKAEAAKGKSQQALIKEHSTMLHDNMLACSQMKPKAGMTEQERDEWFAEHQAIMHEIMSQMMQKEALITSLTNCDTRK